VWSNSTRWLALGFGATTARLPRKLLQACMPSTSACTSFPAACCCPTPRRARVGLTSACRSRAATPASLPHLCGCVLLPPLA
jgi:hypothetical protein